MNDRLTLRGYENFEPLSPSHHNLIYSIPNTCALKSKLSNVLDNRSSRKSVVVTQRNGRRHEQLELELARYLLCIISEGTQLHGKRCNLLKLGQGFRDYNHFCHDKKSRPTKFF